MRNTNTVDVRRETQQNPVADEVSALIAIVQPILQGLLASLKADVVSEVGGPDKVKLRMLNRLRRPGDGDCGICYEYAVHDAIKHGNTQISERVHEALSKHLKVPGSELESILFGAEKNGTKQLIDTAEELLTDDSRLLTGRQAQPPKLKNYLSLLAAAFRRESTRKSLPTRARSDRSESKSLARRGADLIHHAGWAGGQHGCLRPFPRIFARG